jgi:crotonobetainyl-CoA:carnitine CoA-transferase CaiB-like acyl-CoA transferase
MAEMKLPLEGVRVVEMTHMIMGPSCGQFLGFLGAEVIKVEPPEGDKTRDLTGMGAGFFPTFNRGKKSVVLNLKDTADREKLETLLGTADVFIENFRDQTLAKMQLGPKDLRARFPRLIVASCKGFLQGPYENRSAMDEVVQMATGMAYMTGPTGRPLRIGSSANDIMGGLFCAFAVLAQLIAREKTGEGAAVRAGLFENCLLLVAQHMVQFDIEGVEAPPMPERLFSWPVYDIFECRDGRQLFVGAVTETQWQVLCEELGLQDLLADPNLRTRPQQIAARDVNIPKIAAKIAARDFSELMTALEPLGIPFAPIHRPAEMYDDPHVNRADGLFLSHYPKKKDFRAPGLPFTVNGVAPHPRDLDLPTIGQHTDEVFGAIRAEAV